VARAGERSHSRRDDRRPPTIGAPATDFAITTINVPDRLDVQEVRAREAEREHARGRALSVDRYTIVVWTKRLVALAVVVGLAWLAMQTAAPLVDALRADSIAARLSAAVGQPVRIAHTRFEVWPSPRLVLAKVDVGGRLTADEVSLQASWNEVVRAARVGRFAFGEAVVSPVRLDAEQAWLLAAIAPRLAHAAGFSVGALRFSAVEFPGFPLLPHQYQATVKRTIGAASGAFELAQAGGEGSMTLRLVGESEDSVRFELDAQRWRAPVGPGVVWDSVSASGRVVRSAVIVETYTAQAPFGVFQGALVAASDTAWSAAGTVRSTGLDLETLMRFMAGGQPDDANPLRSPLVGMASLELIGGGHGPSLGDALFDARLGGSASVRFGSLNGINLGLAATQGGAAQTGGGTTRFTELSAQVEVADTGVVLRDIRGRAGAMATRGQVVVEPDQSLSGLVRVDLGAERVQAPTTLRVSGTAVAPRFARP
jgi:hypothetical protein